MGFSYAFKGQTLPALWFSLEEIAELFRSHELAEIRGKMVDQEEMIQQEIIRQMNLLKLIRQSQQMLHGSKENV